MNEFVGLASRKTIPFIHKAGASNPGKGIKERTVVHTTVREHAERMWKEGKDGDQYHCTRVCKRDFDRKMRMVTNTTEREYKLTGEQQMKR